MYRQNKKTTHKQKKIMFIIYNWMHRNNHSKYYNFTFNKSEQLPSKTATKYLLHPDVWVVEQQQLHAASERIDSSALGWSSASAALIHPNRSDITVEDDLRMTGHYVVTKECTAVDDTAEVWKEYILKEATLSNHESEALVYSESDPAHQSNFYTWRQEWYTYVTKVKDIINMSEYLKQQLTPYFYQPKCRLDELTLLRVKEFQSSLVKGTHRVLRFLLRCTLDGLNSSSDNSSLYAHLYPRGHYFEVTLEVVPQELSSVRVLYVGGPEFEALENSKQIIDTIHNSVALKTSHVISQAVGATSTSTADTVDSSHCNTSDTISTADNNQSFLYKNNLVLHHNSQENQQLVESVSALTTLTQQCQSQAALASSQSQFTNVFFSHKSSLVPRVPRYTFQMGKTDGGKIGMQLSTRASATVYLEPSIFTSLKVPSRCMLHKLRVNCSKLLHVTVHIVSNDGTIRTSTPVGTTNANLIFDRNIVEDMCLSELEESYYLVEVGRFTPDSATLFSSSFQVRPL